MKKHFKLIIGILIIIIIILIAIVILSNHLKELNNNNESIDSNIASYEDLQIILESPKCVVAFNKKIGSGTEEVYTPMENNKYKRIFELGAIDYYDIPKFIALNDNELFWFGSDSKIYDCTTGDIINNLEEFNNSYNGTINVLGKDNEFIYYKEYDTDNYGKLNLKNKEFTKVKKEDIPYIFQR